MKFHWAGVGVGFGSRMNKLFLSNALLLSVIACAPETIDPPTAELVDGNRNPALSSPLGKTSGEPNDSFGDPMVAVFDAQGLAELQGSVTDRDDLDVFQIGVLRPGDRVRVDAAAKGSSLDVSVALFDDAGRLIVTNDDRCEPPDTLTCLDALLEFTVRRDAAASFLVVTHSAFSDFDRLEGSYWVDVQITADTTAPVPREQVLVLDFDGARITSPVLGVGSLEPFDAANIDRRYDGQTDRIMEKIREVMEQNYERFNVTIVLSDEQPTFSSEIVSTIYFGGFNPMAFGLAEDVDVYNADLCDDAIIFVESFTPEVFTRIPTADGLGVAIGNVAAHEAGHLLGLNHVSDDTDLMDDRSPADVFLTDQEFKESPLSTDIMPIGTQDGALLLLETVGPAK